VSLTRWVASLLRPYRVRVILISSLALLQIGMNLLAPWPLKVVVDNVLSDYPLPPGVDSFVHTIIGDSQVGLLVLIVVCGLLLNVLTEVVRMLHTQVTVDTGQRIVYSLREQLLGHLQALALRHHVVTNTSDSVYRLESDAYSINDLVIGGVFPLLTSFLMLGLMFVILLRMDMTLALLSLAVLPFLYICIRYYTRRMLDRAEHVKELESKLLGRAYEILSSIRIVKSFAREPHELNRFMTTGAATMNARLRLTWQESTFSVMVTAITMSGTALVLGVGGLHVMRGELTVGQLLVVISYLAAVYGPLSTIAHTTGLLQQAIASSRRVRAVFALTPEVLDAENAIDASNIAGDIAFEHVSFSYGDRPIVDDINFVARPGELVALVGLTGAGKTTLASLIPRFYEPTSGRVLIDGRDVSEYRLRSLRQNIALVAQDPVLFGGTVADNIRYGRLDASDAEVEAAARAAHAHDFIMRLPEGYQTSIAQAGASLSGGEKQRLSIARAVIKDAPILILDEPTSSLDAISEAAVFDALRRLRQGRTTLVIAHRLSTIRDANRILVLHEGRVLARGTHSELLVQNELYRRMCARLSVGQSLDDPETVDELMQAIP
jgi:ATP-binding cassette subfamily B protein/subfamily B ATP-binding cassette protein MsbA